MRIGIDRGHNCPPDTGADGIKFEDNIVKELGDLITVGLKQAGHEVIDCCPGKAPTVGLSLHRRCAIANNADCDLYISLHCNAFNTKAYGTEVFAISSTGRKYAQLVLNNLVKLGFANRGVKDGSKLYVVKNTNMPAILVEFFFIDSERDCKLADKLGLETIANTVVDVFK